MTMKTDKYEYIFCSFTRLTCFWHYLEINGNFFKFFPTEILKIESATSAENFVNINVLFVVHVVEVLWGDQGEKWTFSPHDVSQKVELAG
jgi:hypothetical protein